MLVRCCRQRGKQGPHRLGLGGVEPDEQWQRRLEVLPCACGIVHCAIAVAQSDMRVGAGEWVLDLLGDAERGDVVGGGVVGAPRRAGGLAERVVDCGAQMVSLADGSVGWLREDDLSPFAAAEPWVALLPLLDPTVMGWKGRAFYLGPHASQLFDSAGNAGTTAWVDGRVVGAWVQDPDGVVQLRLLDGDVTRHRPCSRAPVADQEGPDGPSARALL